MLFRYIRIDIINCSLVGTHMIEVYTDVIIDIIHFKILYNLQGCIYFIYCWPIYINYQ